MRTVLSMCLVVVLSLACGLGGASCEDVASATYAVLNAFHEADDAAGTPAFAEKQEAWRASVQELDAVLARADNGMSTMVAVDEAEGIRTQTKVVLDALAEGADPSVAERARFELDVHEQVLPSWCGGR